MKTTRWMMELTRDAIELLQRKQRQEIGNTAEEICEYLQTRAVLIAEKRLRQWPKYDDYGSGEVLRNSMQRTADGLAIASHDVVRGLYSEAIIRLKGRLHDMEAAWGCEEEPQ